MPEFQLGEWLPDQPQIALPGLIDATNMLPTATGYTTFAGPSEIAGLSSLGAICRGAHAAQTQYGTRYTVAGTASTVKVVWSIGDWIDVTPADIANFAPKGQWEFDLYGDRLIAIADRIIPCSINTVDLSGNADPPQESSNIYTALSADVSFAKTCAVFKEFLILGNIVGRGANSSSIYTKEAGLHWSAIGDPTDWPTIATQDAIDKQSDIQVLDGSGGEITALVPAGEYLFCARERQVWRVDYVGSPNIFSFRLADPARGCMLPRCAVAVGGVVYYPSAEGFMAFDGANVRNIGLEKVDRTWRAEMDFNNTNQVCGAHNPETHSVYWTISSGTNTPTKLFAYRYDIDRWFQVDTTAEWLTNTFAVSVGGNLDAEPYSLYQMDGASYTPDDWQGSHGYLVNNVVKSTTADYTGYAYICTVFGLSGSTSPTGSSSSISDGTVTWRFYGLYGVTTLQDANLDKLGVSESNSALATFDSMHQMQVFNDSASPLSGTITTGDFEVPNRSRAILRWVRPIYEGTATFSGKASARIAPNDSVNYKDLTGASPHSSVGVLSAKSSARVGGRYMRAQFGIAGGAVENFSGFDSEISASSRR